MPFLMIPNFLATGSPRVGNFAFVDAFKWLVGLSYRCVYERDAVPDRPRSVFLSQLQGALPPHPGVLHCEH